jgi:hypothetical protein
MLQREARVVNPEAEPLPRRAERPRKQIVVRSWEGPILVIAVIAIMALGFIGGLNSVISMFK